ncbi:MAG: RHS repeat-associated core domain-containing protein [Nitrospirae bacterium]|nr:RHS repeat-associated core domain-containing protein [Nitrospirota bacterium]
MSGAATVYIGQLYECTQTGACTRYVFAGDDRIAMRTSAGDFNYYHTDHLGISTIITKGNDPTPSDPSPKGSVTQTLLYEPYGKIRASTSTVDVHHKFTGQERDDSTGLDFFQARYYSPGMHRFISPDSIVPSYADPQSLNRYSYVRNNPVLYTDPSGHIFGIDDAIIIATVVAMAKAAVVSAAISATVNVAVAAATGGDIGKAAVSGAISGAILGPTGVGAGMVTNAALKMVIYAAGGAAAGAASSAATGGNVGMSAAIGAVSGLTFGVVGWATPASTPDWAKALIQVGTSAVVGGASAEVMGGSFGQGALQGALAAGIWLVAQPAVDFVAAQLAKLKQPTPPETATTVDGAQLAPGASASRTGYTITVRPYCFGPCTEPDIGIGPGDLGLLLQGECWPVLSGNWLCMAKGL